MKKSELYQVVFDFRSAIINAKTNGEFDSRDRMHRFPGCAPYRLDFVARNETNLNLCRNELHGNIITDVVNDNCRIFAYFTSDSVVETVIQPFV